MKKLLCLLPATLLLCSCGKGAMVNSPKIISILGKTDEVRIFILVIFFELITTVLPLFLTLMILRPEKIKNNFEEAAKEHGFFAGFIGVLSLISYFTPDAISALICIAILAGVPLLMRYGYEYKVSWGRAFGTLGLFILFSSIAEILFVAMFG